MSNNLFLASAVTVIVNPAGDIQLSLHHSGCSCCSTVALPEPDQAEQIADRLRFAAGRSRAQKAQAGVIAEESRA